MKFACVILALFSNLCFGAASSATFSAKLISFNQKTAEVEDNGFRYTVPRSSLGKGTPLAGESVKIKLKGPELAEFLKKYWIASVK